MKENNITFGELLNEWLPTIKETMTKSSYDTNFRDVNYLVNDIGEILISEMTKEFFEDYFKKLDTRNHEVGYAIAKKDIRCILLRNGFRREVLRKEMGIMSSTLSYVYNRSKLTIKWAVKFSEQINIPCEELFDIYSIKKQYAPATIYRTKCIINQAFDYGKTKGYIDINYVETLFTKINKPKSKKPTSPTKKAFHHTFETVLNYPDIRVRSAVLLLFAFNFDRLEVYSLDWNCFNFEKNTISSKARTVKIPPVIMEIFKDYKLWQHRREPYDNEYIFRKTDGSKIHNITLKGWFRKILKKANLEKYTLKDFQQAQFDYTKIPIKEVPKIELVGRQQYYEDPKRKEMYELGFKTYNDYLEYLEYLSALDAHKKCKLI